MPAQTHKQTQPTKTAEPEAEVEPVDLTTDKFDDLDGLLDEIDTVLEPNAQEFVASYIQRGGQ